MAENIKALEKNSGLLPPGHIASSYNENLTIENAVDETEKVLEQLYQR